jgi:hypothetical protein
MFIRDVNGKYDSECASGFLGHSHTVAYYLKPLDSTPCVIYDSEFTKAEAETLVEMNLVERCPYSACGAPYHALEGCNRKRSQNCTAKHSRLNAAKGQVAVSIALREKPANQPA